MLELLAVLSVSAAVGMRIALPLLVIGLLYGDSLWAQIPLLSLISPPIILGLLASWSLVEVVAFKNRTAQRLLQTIQIVFSPVIGAIMGITIARATISLDWLVWILGTVGGLLALVLQLVQTGWIYRLKRIPLWAVFAEDILCIALVLCAFDAPRQGGLIALLLLWLAIRSSKEWHRWYREQSTFRRKHPRQYKQDPD